MISLNRNRLGVIMMFAFIMGAFAVPSYAADMLKPLDTAINGVTGTENTRTNSGIMRSNDPCDRPALKLKKKCQKPRFKIRHDGVVYRNGRIVKDK